MNWKQRIYLKMPGGTSCQPHAILKLELSLKKYQTDTDGVLAIVLHYNDRASPSLANLNAVGTRCADELRESGRLDALPARGSAKLLLDLLLA